MAHQQWDNRSSRGGYRQDEDRGQRSWRGSSRSQSGYGGGRDDNQFYGTESLGRQQEQGLRADEDLDFGGSDRDTGGSDYYGTSGGERDFGDNISRGSGRGGQYGSRESRYGGYDQQSRGGGSQSGRASGYRGIQDWPQQSDIGRLGPGGYGASYGGSGSQFQRSSGNQQGYGSGQNQQSFRGRGPKGYQRSDERLKEVICECLTDDDDIDASEITITVKSGEVTLSGTVPDRQTKHLAENRVAELSGVQEVNNQLRVKSSSSGGSGSSDSSESGNNRSRSASGSTSGSSGSSYSSGSTYSSGDDLSDTSTNKDKSSKRN